MKKLKDFMFLLMWLLVLSLILSSCGKISEITSGKTKDGKVKITNSSSFSSDDPVNIQLIKVTDRYGDRGEHIYKEEVLADKQLAKNRSITFTDVPLDVSLTIKIKDQNGREVFYRNISLTVNETLKLNYNGDFIKSEGSYF